MYNLTASQLFELQVAVQELDAYLLLCVDNLRKNRWVHTKHVADCQVHELVVFYFSHFLFFFFIKRTELMYFLA